MQDVKNLETYAIIGFDGSAIRGLKAHPDGEHIVYPMGNKVCIQNWKSKKMSFLSGHSNSVSTVAVSPNGNFVGSGQINHIGFKAAVKVWDFKKKTMIGTHELHKVRVEALAFSSDERYLISLGGRDDGCVVTWHVLAASATGTAAATRLTTGDAVTLVPLTLRHNSFVTGGDSNLRIWNIRAETKNLDVVDVSLGKLRRCVRCITVSKDDAYGIAGTTLEELTGKPRDLVQLKGFWKRSKVAAKKKKTISQHRRALQATGGGQRPTSPSSEDLKIVDMCPTDFVIKENIYECDATLQVAGHNNASILEGTEGQNSTIYDIDEDCDNQLEGSFVHEIITVADVHKDEVDIKAPGSKSASIDNLSMFIPKTNKENKKETKKNLTGDLIKFSIKYPSDPNASVSECKPALIGCFAKCGPWKKGKRPESLCYSQGVESIIIMDDGCLIVGSGDGTVDILDEINWKGGFPKGRVAEPNVPNYQALKSTKLDGSITSLELMESKEMQGDKRILLAGTRTSEIYAINIATFAPTLVVTCHRCAINDIAFPAQMSGVFVTAGAGDLRVWCLQSCRELLRVLLPNFSCSAVLFSHDGKSIVSAWSDGNIRAFTPLTGRLVYCIYNTHNKGTSALGITRDGRTLVSGGCEGQVRVWDVKPTCQSLKKVLKEHKSPVSAIQVSPNDTEAVSAGTDGSCIIWDLVSLSRRQVMYANTLFMCVCFEPRGCQLLTGGTDRRVAYWEAGSGNLARELEASKVGAINGLDISEDGNLFVTGGNDQMVKVWRYQEGVYSHAGLGHAGAVTCCRFSPDCRYIVSCCAAGSIIVWKVPEQYLVKEKPTPRQASAQSNTNKNLQEELRIPLDDKPKGSGDKQHRLPAAPSKMEKIEAMNTARGSVHSCCPCDETARSNQSVSDRSAKKTGAGVKCCRPPDKLPTRTTSKEFVCGSGDRK